MASKDLRTREIWQNYSGENAGQAEKDLLGAFNIVFKETDFRIIAKPKDFSKIYVDIAISGQQLLEIFTPDAPITRHGVFPDFAINNVVTQKTIYIEVKRQDGWIEGKNRSAGRGNAHERSCKLFTPGLQKILRSKGNLGDNVLPFWTVFMGDITRDPCRVREITCWYDEYIAHYFFWRDSKNPESLLNHFDTYIQPLLL